MKTKFLTHEQQAEVDQFKGYLISHPNLATAHQKAWDAILRTTGPRIVIVTGPTGVGKSTLANRLCRDLQQFYKDEVAQDPGFIPVTQINAIAPSNTAFNWKDFYVRFLMNHGDVMIDRKLPVPQQGELFRLSMTATGLERSVPDALRRSVESSLRQRRTKVLVIDEAHHMLMVSNPAKLEYQFETLKSLTIESNATIVLVGTYRLLDIRDHSGQLVRRSEIVHLPRYDTCEELDKQGFTNVVNSLLRKLPIKTTMEFGELMNLFYLKSGGCVGILKDWLARCFENALLAGKTTFDQADLEACALDNKGLCTIVTEAMAGEAKLKDVSAAELRRILFRETALDTPRPAALATTRRRGRRVGERIPKRDPVGEAFHVARAI